MSDSITEVKLAYETRCTEQFTLGLLKFLGLTAAAFVKQKIKYGHIQVLAVFGFGDFEVNFVSVSEILLYGQWCWNPLEVNVIIQFNALQNIINILCDSST